ncbi:MAG: c-type cytochrome [Pseudomonadales bacterium]|nr:c-type cytochrome [Pseudomonadales bacterium]
MLISQLRKGVLAVLLNMLLQSGAVLADGAVIAREQCASCHALERPDYDKLGLAERLQRKAPPLYYAGNKYRREWLLQQLQQPERIYPAGYFPLAPVLITEEGDMPDPAALIQHPALTAEQAAEVTDFLMSLRPYDDLIAADNYEPGKVAMRMAMMDFRKFKGCDACHQDAADSGGFSGPSLLNAWRRLQPEFLSSFTQNPRAWDPNSIMPVPQMNEAAIHKLVDYLKLIGGEQ